MKKVAKTKPSTSVSLEKLIPMYGRDKMQMNELKKATDLANKRIKELMVAKKITEKEAGGFIASYSVRTSESINEDALLDFAKNHKALKDCVKTREYVDMDTLENLIYTGKIPKKMVAELDKFRIKKEVEYLNINLAKENK